MQRVDKTLYQTLRDKFGDTLQRLQAMDGQAYEELFTNACPKFITISAPNYEDKTSVHQAGRTPLRSRSVAGM